MQCRQRDIEIEIRIFYGIKPLQKNPAILISIIVSIFYFAKNHLFARIFKKCAKISRYAQGGFPETNERSTRCNISSNRRIDSRWKMAELRRREGDARVELPTWTNNRLMTCKYGEANQAAVLTGHEKRPRAPFVPARAKGSERERERVFDTLSMYLRARPAHMHRARTYLMVAR